MSLLKMRNPGILLRGRLGVLCLGPVTLFVNMVLFRWLTALQHGLQ